MKKKIFWMIAAILVLCGSVSGIILCEKANAQEENAPAVFARPSRIGGCEV